MSTSTTCTAKRIWNAEILFVVALDGNVIKLCFLILRIDSKAIFIDIRYHLFSLSLRKRPLSLIFIGKNVNNTRNQLMNEIYAKLCRDVCALTIFFPLTFSFPCASCFYKPEKVLFFQHFSVSNPREPTNGRIFFFIFLIYLERVFVIVVVVAVRGNDLYP